MNYGINALTIKNKSIVFLVIGGIIFLSIAPLPVLSPVLILLFGIMMGVLIVSVFAHDDFNFLFGFYLLGFGIRAFLSFLFYILSFCLEGRYSLGGFFFRNDGWCYSQQGWFIHKFAERGIHLTKDTFLSDPNLHILLEWGGGWSGNITVYDFFSAFIYSITGRSPLSLFFISTVAGSMAALFIYLIAKEIFSKKVARISSLFAFFWPSFVLWSTQHLKEPMIVMFICILVWSIFCICRRFSALFLLLSILSVWVLSKIGFPYLIIVIAMIFFTGFILLMGHLFKNRFVPVLFIGLLIFAVLFPFRRAILFYIVEKNIFYGIGGHTSVFEFLNFSRNARAYGNLAFFIDADISSFGKMVMFSPLAFLYAVFAPFPWQLGSTNQIMVAPETILFYILFPFTLRGMAFAYRNRFNESLLLFLFIIALMWFLGIVEGNIGTLFRHRSVAYYLVFIFTAVGMSLERKRRYKCEQRL